MSAIGTAPGRVNALLVSCFDFTTAEVTPAARLREDLGLDSLDVAMLSHAIADTFGVEVDDREVTRWRSVGDVHATVERLAPNVA